MSLLRRAPREVYRVYEEDDYLSDGDDHPAEGHLTEGLDHLAEGVDHPAEEAWPRVEHPRPPEPRAHASSRFWGVAVLGFVTIAVCSVIAAFALRGSSAPPPAPPARHVSPARGFVPLAHDASPARASGPLVPRPARKRPIHAPTHAAVTVRRSSHHARRPMGMRYAVHASPGEEASSSVAVARPAWTRPGSILRPARRSPAAQIQAEFGFER